MCFQAWNRDAVLPLSMWMMTESQRRHIHWIQMAVLVSHYSWNDNQVRLNGNKSFWAKDYLYWCKMCDCIKSLQSKVLLSGGMHRFIDMRASQSSSFFCKKIADFLLMLSESLNTSIFGCCRWYCWNMFWRWPSSCHDAPSRALHTVMAVALDASRLAWQVHCITVVTYVWKCLQLVC